MKKNKIVILTLYFVLSAFSLFASPLSDGNALYKKKKLDGALDKYKEAQIDEPNSPLPHMNSGSVFYRMGKYKDAIDEFKKAEQKCPLKDKKMKSWAWYNIGNAHFKAGEFQEAKEAFKKSLLTNPKNMDAKYNLGLTQQMLKLNQNQPQNSDKDKEQNKGDQKKQQQDKEPSQDQKKSDAMQKQAQEKADKENAKQLIEALSSKEKNPQLLRDSSKNSNYETEKDW